MQGQPGMLHDCTPVLKENSCTVVEFYCIVDLLTVKIVTKSYRYKNIENRKKKWKNYTNDT